MGSGLKTKRQEAKAAADAAAAAAADACAICDKVYGEDAEKDESWIACDRCNRWYHGTCVGMTQVWSYCPLKVSYAFIVLLYTQNIKLHLEGPLNFLSWGLWF